MKQLIRALSTCLILLLVFAFSAQAQVHTAKTNTTVSSRCKGYYEYLPQGYNPSGSTTYPLLLFITGIGEFGNGGSTHLPRVLLHGPPKLINTGAWPDSFTAGGLTHKFIVITPQFAATPVTAADVDTVITYMVSKYKINVNRIYITGLSYGGGLSFAYPGNANTTYRSRIAASVPIAVPLPDGGYDTIYARSRRIAAGNVPVWATHNSGDTPDSASRTTAYINYINQAPAPNPLAKKTIFSAGGHDSWTKTYDPSFRENGYNIYEWMLLHQKGSPPPAPNAAPTANAGADKTITLPTNSVTLSGTGADSDGSIVAYNWTKVSGPVEGTITSPSATSTTVTGLAAGIYTFRLMVSDNKSAKGVDDVKVTVNYAAGTKVIQVNVFGGSNSYSSTAWNNWNIGTAAGSNITSTAFKYVDAAASTVTATISATTAIKDNGSTYGTGVAMAPGPVLRYTSQHNVSRSLTLNGLATTKTYKVELYASFKATTSNNNTVFTVNGTPVTINVNNNAINKAVFASVAPNASGQIVITIGNTSTYNYLNGFTVTENGNTPPPPSEKFVKVNLFGGTNPYSNAEWNNWNVSASTTASALKYSDGTTSTAGVAISANAISDNGSTYGGTMCPPEVLRYTSYGGARTLTLSGLSTTKTYNLELYASRANTGNSTIFTIGGTSITIVTDHNKTNKASFTALRTNTAGQIVVSIGKTATYSYLNGFVLTEVNNTTTKATRNTAAGEETTTTATVQAFPNPVSSSIRLQLQNSYKGAVQVQVTDASGQVQKAWQFVKNNTVMQQNLPVSNLAGGIYFVTVQMGAERRTIPVAKTR